MGLDIYAGTLTRYYTRNWKTVVQQRAEQAGGNCVVQDSNGQELKPVEDSAEVKEIREAMCSWRDDLATVLHPHPSAPLWDEEHDKDYFTDKPNWGAYGALVMLQASRFMHCSFPEYIEAGMNTFDDPMVKKALAQKFPSTLLSDVIIWIPFDDRLVCGPVTLPSAQETMLSTVEFLRDELEELNKERWKADEATIRSWAYKKYYVPVNSEKPRSFFGFIRRPPKTEKEVYRTEDLAQCAFSMFWQAVQFALTRRVPILLDF